MSLFSLGIAAHSETDELLHIYLASLRDGPMVMRAISVNLPNGFAALWRVIPQLHPEYVKANNAFARGVYRHYRDGDFYQGIGVAEYNDTTELLAIYVALMGAHMPGPRLRARPLEMFLEEVDSRGEDVSESGPGVHPCKVARFTHVGDEIPAWERPKKS